MVMVQVRMVVVMQRRDLRLRLGPGLWQGAEGIRLQRALRRAWRWSEGIWRGC
jgi:hypothetical protein